MWLPGHPALTAFYIAWSVLTTQGIETAARWLPLLIKNAGEASLLVFSVDEMQEGVPSCITYAANLCLW